MASATTIAADAVGGAVGAVLRYRVSLSFGAGLFCISGPFAILLVNIAGSGLPGFLPNAVAAGMVLPEAWPSLFAHGLIEGADHFFQLCA